MHDIAPIIQRAAAEMKAGRFEAAADLYQRAIELFPNHPLPHHAIGVAFSRTGRLRDAASAQQNAIRLKGDYLEAWIALARTLSSLADHAGAESAARRAVQIKPSDPAANYHLAHVLMVARKSDDAIEQYRRTMALDPSIIAAPQNLANLLGEAGEIDETIALQRKVIELAPRNAALHSNLLLSLHYTDSFTPQDIFAEHVEWATRHAPPELRRRNHPNDRSSDRKLRIGYVSPDFNRHPVASFLEAIFTSHDREQFEVFAYSNTREPDAMTTRFMQMVDHWRDIRANNDEQAAQQIAQDQIDILIDLAGHTANNRATLFARQSAPVQVTYLGYPDTTGMQAVQYRLTDAQADPPGATEGFHSEQLIRLPESFLCYQPDADVAEPGGPPCERNGFVTFGSLNNFAKVNASMLETWATVLSRVPNSKLLLKARALASERARRRVVETFAAQGIAADRLLIHGWTSYPARHALTQSVDLALDTFPYHGTTTTCEVLWSAVPTITLAGTTHASRVGVSILTSLGRKEWIATDRPDYIERAVALANDAARLREARKTLREQFRSSPLFDKTEFTRNLEAALRSMWKDYVSAPSTV